MFLQLGSYECGAIAFANAVKALGGSIDIQTAKKLAGTNYREGTSRHGIIKASFSLGYKATPYHTRNPDNAWKWIKRHAPFTPLVCLVDLNNHWICISGVIGDKVILVDGSPNNGENGVDALGKQETLERLCNRGHYYAIRVSRL